MLLDEPDPTDTAAQEELRERQADEDRARRDQDVEDLKWLLADKRGRRFFWRLLTLTHMFHTSFSLHNGDMSRMEGERNIGLQLWADLHEHAPNAYSQMVKEQRNARSNRH